MADEEYTDDELFTMLDSLRERIQSLEFLGNKNLLDQIIIMTHRENDIRFAGSKNKDAQLNIENLNKLAGDINKFQKEFQDILVERLKAADNEQEIQRLLEFVEPYEIDYKQVQEALASHKQQATSQQQPAQPNKRQSLEFMDRASSETEARNRKKDRKGLSIQRKQPETPENTKPKKPKR